MGRGRQKAKQQKIARKLKYLTTDTDYDELAKELSAQEVGTGSFDPFADVEGDDRRSGVSAKVSDVQSDSPSERDDDLDEYAKWAAEAAEAAAKATSGEPSSVAASAKATPKPHRPIPIPMPSALKHKKA
ncbi:DUF3073 domain-containing protein [Bifidobacterium sp. UBA744]|uniref:DUF3073 domain-containing protein n=1 Tax=Bifidobacterium sp. UBA744 TaxID=1946112 RepID=UPI0025C272A8|nr:DUF3073 domain-containing protein [Bifidobacterium sp. UBA744]